MEDSADILPFRAIPGDSHAAAFDADEARRQAHYDLNAYFLRSCSACYAAQLGRSFPSASCADCADKISVSRTSILSATFCLTISYCARS